MLTIYSQRIFKRNGSVCDKSRIQEQKEINLTEHIKRRYLFSIRVCMTRFWNDLLPVGSKSNDWKAK